MGLRMRQVEGEHALLMLLRHERPLSVSAPSGLPGRIDDASDTERSRKLHGDALMHDQPRDRDARLALVVEDRPGGASDRGIVIARRGSCRARPHSRHAVAWLAA
jgi:hypothetical protein